MSEPAVGGEGGRAGPEPGLGPLLRELAPQVLGGLVRRTGDFDGAEDAVQDALLEASVRWPAAGVPDDPRAWLATVAGRRLVDRWRSESARRRREETVAALHSAPAPGPAHDDSLELLLLCCHPALTPPSQVALTLRAVGGLTTAEIARAFLVPEATVGQRISRAKAGIRAAGTGFVLPGGSELAGRLPVVCAVLYLVFTEGHTASSGASLGRVDLTTEAIRLTRMLYARVEHLPAVGPQRGEVAGLLALMLLTEARRPARVGPDGALVPLEAQDRRRWDRSLVAEGVGLVTSALTDAPLGPYQLQAAIAAVHDEAPAAEATDWRQILGLYDLLRVLDPSPMATLNRAVALAMVQGPGPALLELDASAVDPALAGHHRLHSVRAHLLERLGERTAAAEEYRAAARLTLSLPERRYLLARAAVLS